MRLVDAEEVERLFNAQIEQGATDAFDAFDDALQDALTIDAAPVVHGVWVRVNKIDPISGYRCSKCRRMVGFDLTPYCPNCGARMDGGNAEG